MDEFRFVHAADLRLDTPFTGIGLTPTPVSRALCDASLHAWEALVRLTIENRAECLLLSGGLYDGPELGLRAQISLGDGLRTLAESDIPVFMVLGERDRIDARSVVSRWPKNVTILDSVGMSVPLRRAGRHLATIHGASHPVRDVAPTLRRTIRPEDPSGLRIGMLHCAVGSEEATGLCPTVAVEELRSLPVHYWALGHEPSRRYVSQDPWIVYPGTPQGRVATTGGDASGAIVAEVANGAIRQLSFEALDVVRCRSVEIEDAESLERTDLLRQALDRGQALRQENGGRALLLEVCLRARTGPVDELDTWLVSELRTRTEDWDPFVWWMVSDDRSTREPLRSEAVKRSEVASLVLDRSDALLGTVLPRSSFLARQLEPLRRVWEAELDLDEAKVLMREATALAIDELTDGPIE